MLTKFTLHVLNKVFWGGGGGGGGGGCLIFKKIFVSCYKPFFST